MKKFFCAILLIIISASAFSDNKKKILASIPPVAGLTKMIVGDLYDVELIQRKPACPHHYNLKPSQHKLIKEADIIIYINDSFESSIADFASTTNSKKIILSNFQGINLDNNFHIWLNLDNLKIILNNLYNILYEIDDEDAKAILTINYNLALKKLDSIKPKKIEGKMVFIGHSLKHLINDVSEDNLYVKKVSSLKATTDLQRQIAFLAPKCIIYDSAEGIKSLTSLYKGKLIGVDVENWGKISNLENFVTDYMSEIYRTINDCD